MLPSEQVAVIVKAVSPPLALLGPEAWLTPFLFVVAAVAAFALSHHLSPA